MHGKLMEYKDLIQSLNMRLSQKELEKRETELETYKDNRQSEGSDNGIYGVREDSNLEEAQYEIEEDKDEEEDEDEDEDEDEIDDEDDYDQDEDEQNYED
ncbi:hypothetical protein BDZ91DRAFT_797407 [Kalaharituber pfeilii]|nr:hypothetical protein BDZ91DRAFT_797407 [Kalaharituber pfeilii]